MKKSFLCVMIALTFLGCVDKKEENLKPPEKPAVVGYNMIVPNSASTASNAGSTIAIKATQCLPLYYDKQLIRVNCFLDGDWIRKDDDWEYKGKNVIFAGLVKAYYRINE